MNRRNFNQFLGKISKFPSWIKIILSKEIAGNNTNNLIYLYTTYRPILTYKGNCELDSNKTVCDRNLYKILELIKKDIARVISRYMLIDAQNMEIQISKSALRGRGGKNPSLYANVPILDLHKIS